MNYAPNQVLAKPLSPEQAIMYETGKKSVGLAILFGLILTGGGQMYAGKIGRGAAFWGAGVFFVILSFFLIGLPFLIGLIIWSLFDAKSCVEEHNTMHLHRITTGQIFQPGLTQPMLSQPMPAAPSAQPQMANPGVPQVGPPPPSSQTTVGSSAAPPPPPPSTPPPPPTVSPTRTDGGRLVLGEDDF